MSILLWIFVYWKSAPFVFITLSKRKKSWVPPKLFCSIRYGKFRTIKCLCYLKKKIISRARFWSSDLWVMGPARFHCATLLLICKRFKKKSFNRHSRITFSFDSLTCAFCIKTFSLRDAYFTLNICVFRVSSIYIYNPFQKEKKLSPSQIILIY